MTDPTIAEQVGRELAILISFMLALIGIAGAWIYGGKLYDDWKERRRVRRIMKGVFPGFITPGHKEEK